MVRVGYKVLHTKVVTLISLLFLQWAPNVFMCTSIVRLVPGATHWVRSGTMQPHSATSTRYPDQRPARPGHLGTAAARRLQAGPRTAPRCSTAPPPCSPRCSAAASPRRAAAASPPSPPPCTSCWCCYYLDLLTINRRSCTITEKATTVFTFKTLLKHYAKWALTP